MANSITEREKIQRGAEEFRLIRIITKQNEFRISHLPVLFAHVKPV
jgi:hypothetical protein